MSRKLSVFPYLFVFGASLLCLSAEEKLNKQIPLLSPKEFLKTVEIQDGYYLEAVLSDPDIKEPVDIAFDGNGRMYVVEMRTYMQDADFTGEMEAKSVVSRHEDTNGDGIYDKHTVFADKLILPRKIIVLDDGVVIGETNTHDLYLYKDTNNDGVADQKTLWYQGGERGGNMEHQPQGFVWGLDNWLYSTYNDYRLRYTRGKVEMEKISSNSGQWGITQDNYGKVWFVNAGGEQGPVHYQSHIEYGKIAQPESPYDQAIKEVWPIDNIPDVQGGLHRIRENNTLNHYTATCGQVIYRGDRLPQELQGNLFFSEPVGRLIRRLVISEEDGLVKLSHPYHEEKKEFIRSTDPNFRVVNGKTAPDGSLYFVDMYRGIIQQGNWTRPGSYLRGVIDEYGLAQNINHGRIWRLRHKDYSLGQMPNMLAETPDQLIAHLGHPNGWWRDQAQKLIVLKADKSVIPKLISMAKQSNSALERLHAYWTLEGLDALNEEMVIAALHDSDPKLSESAMRFAEVWMNKNSSIKNFYMDAAQGSNHSIAKQAMLSLKKIKAPEFLTLMKTLPTKPGFESLTWLFAELSKGEPTFQQLTSMSLNDQKLFHKGRQIFQMLCIECHGEDALGKKTEGGQMGPSLVSSPRVNGPAETILEIIMNGMTGPLDGKNYLAGMMFPNKTQNDEWIASVATYVRNDFGNNASPIRPDQVQKLRKASEGKTDLWTQSELEAHHNLYLKPTKEWKVSSSHNPKAVNSVIDGNVKTRFSTNAKQEKGMWVQVDFPDIKTISGLFLDTSTSINDYPRSFEVAYSKDGHEWSKPIVSKKNNQTKIELLFEEIEIKAIKFTLTENYTRSNWSIHDLKFYGKKS